MSELRRILVVELLGGFGDVLLVLPAVHALARSHPDAELTVLTFTPGDVLLAHDPLVARVVATSDHTDGVPRRVVEAELDAAEAAGRPYDLVVTTTTYDGIGDLCAARAPRAVTNLWRNPPADERIDRRFLRLLVADGAGGPRVRRRTPRRSPSPSPSWPPRGPGSRSSGRSTTPQVGPTSEVRRSSSCPGRGCG